MSGSTYTRIDSTLPRVAIAGRPNVGKSTLFNRLIGTRRAITDPTPGVTRDPVEAECKIDGIRVLLVDTGGYRTDVEDIERMVSERSARAIEDADVTLLMIEVGELTPEDEELVAIVRARAQRSILVVNKVDHDRHEGEAWNLHSLGFSQVVHISAEHKRNIDRLRHEVRRQLLAGGSAHKREPASDTDRIRLALLGKPNTGKSTLLNRLVGEERSIVSPIPGTTRDTIEAVFRYRGNDFTVVDTGGIRRKRSIRESIEYFSVHRAIGTIERSDVVLQVVDATEGITEQDKKIATQIIRRGRGVVLVFNKWDLVEQIANAFNAIRDRTRFVFPVLSYVPFVPVCAVTGEGVETALLAAVRVWKQLQTEIATGPLNRALHGWEEQHPVPHGGGPRYAVRYMTQVSSHPLKFLLFVNRVRGFPESWLAYLRNRMREEFGIGEVPFTIDLRES